MLVGELEGLDQTKGLLDASTNGEIVDGDLPENSLRIDDEQAAEGDAGFLEEHAVRAGDVLAQVRKEGILEAAESTGLGTKNDKRHGHGT